MWKMKIGIEILVFLFVFGGVQADQLTNNFYQTSCPNLKQIVVSVLNPIFANRSDIPAALVRLMFHDCQVQGCDASILVDSPTTELSSSKNFAIHGRDVIGMLKKIVESVCPAKVSCADLIILAAREAIASSKGPLIRVPLGRRDSSTSPNKTLADIFIPDPQTGVGGMITIFKQKGMTLKESVAILGAHTLGVSHCLNIKPDPSSPTVKAACPRSFTKSNTSFVENDPTPTIFDNSYFRNAKAGFGVLRIDQEMASNKKTASIVNLFAAEEEEFFRAFTSAFLKLASSNVLTGKQGVIRKECSKIMK